MHKKTKHIESPMHTNSHIDHNEPFTNNNNNKNSKTSKK